MQTVGGTPSPEDIEKQIIKTAVKLDPRDIEGEIYLDVETLRLSHEVPGGWSNIKDFGLAVAVTWNLNEFRAWFESDAADLIAELSKFSRIVTYNGERFDFEVLSAYGDVSALRREKSFDVLAHIKRQMGCRIKLDDAVAGTLGVRKSGDGLDAVAWWREGQRDKVVTYCRHDVELLIRLVGYARENGYIVIDGRRVAVNWLPRRARGAAAGRE